MEIREKALAKVKERYLESVEPVKERFSMLRLKDGPMTVIDSVTEEDTDITKRHFRELFPTCNLD